MIMTILKQTIRFHLDEKEHEIASVYAELYSKMVVQYVNKREQALAALKDLAYEFHIYGHHRSALKYYLEVKKQYGDSALNDQDILYLAESCEKLGQANEALLEYQRLIRYYPYSPHVKMAYENISRIYQSCSNQNKAEMFKKMALLEPNWDATPVPAKKVS
ncbi:MAG: hypothetical protein JW774_01725 [Candidatus Aureabacteria bacterium]|nr:hypothetical protein [Candidatus Auribacterota bacterium]